MRVFLITGFALDKRAFLRLDLPPETFRLADLIPAERGESLREYALRLGAELGVTGDDVIGGVSLGGMLALEIAKAVGARGLILIASCPHPRYLRKRFLFLAPIAPLIPDFLIRKIFALVPWVLSRQGMLSPPDQALLAEVMGNFPPALLKRMPRKILRWPGCIPGTPEGPAAPLRQIHSDGDWMIRRNGPHGKDATRVLLKGHNHLITVSHPREVRRFLLEAVEEFSRDKTHTSA